MNMHNTDNPVLRCVIIVTVLVLQGCATHDARDAAWDPSGAAQLFDQIPAWDGAAAKICCGHLRECEPHQSARC